MTILTITGGSGVGKTTLRDCLIAQYSPPCAILPSVTTRAPRGRDRSGEFIYLTEDEFTRREHQGEFLWTITVHGTKYALEKGSALDALSSNTLFFAVITHDKVPELVAYAGAESLADHIHSLFILSPPKRTLQKRMKKRGDPPAEIRTRLKSCRLWDEEARQLSLLCTLAFFQNNEGISELFDQVVSWLKRMGAL